MPVPVDFVRGVLGVLCIFFAYMAGLAAAAVRRGGKPARLYAWLIRTVLCAGILIFRQRIDAVAVAVWALAAAAFAGGMWSVGRRPQQEDLTREIFPQ